MQYLVEIAEEDISRLRKGKKRMTGVISIDESTSMLTFKAFNDRKKKVHNRVQLEHGWLDETSDRLKFFNSVRKELGVQRVYEIMQRELKGGMTAKAVDALLGNEIDNN